MSNSRLEKITNLFSYVNSTVVQPLYNGWNNGLLNYPVQDLYSRILSQSPLLKEKTGLIGKLLGTDYIVTLESDKIEAKDFKAIMKACDQQSESRGPYGAFSYITDSQHFFHTESKNPMHRSQMNDLNLFFRKNDLFVTCLMDICSEYIEKEITKDPIHVIKAHAKDIVRRVFLKIFFDTDAFAFDSHAALDSFCQHGFNGIDTVGGYGYFLQKSFRSARSDYQAFSQKFLDSQLPKIMHIISSYPQEKDKNILANVIVRLIREQHPDWDEKRIQSVSAKEVMAFFNRLEVKQLPSIFLVGENVIAGIVNGMAHLNQSQLSKNSIKVEINDVKADLATLFDLPSVQKIYKEILQMVGANNTISRYTEKPISVGNIQIPAKSRVQIKAGAYPFSMGSRSCPGTSIANKMIKAAIIKSLIGNTKTDELDPSLIRKKGI